MNTPKYYITFEAQRISSRAWTVCFLSIFSFLLAAPALAAVSPMLIPFQGRLTNPKGVPYTNDQFTIVFNLYDQAVGGTRLWTETHYKVGIINGMVNVFLGSIEPLTSVPGGFSEVRHLGITIDADNNPNTPDPEMIPRQMIIPAFWAKRSENSTKLGGFAWGDLLANGATNPVTGTISGAKISPGTITGANVANATLTSANIANGAVGSAQLAPQAVQAAHIANGAVGSTQLGSQAVQTANIADGAVGTAQLAAGAFVFAPRSVQVFTSSGTWTKPPGVSRIYVKVIGRGGKGADANNSLPRGGGGGGGYAEGPIDVTGNVTVTIGEINSFAGVNTIQATSGSNGSDFAGGTGGIGIGGVINLRGGSGQNVSAVDNGTGGMGGASAMGPGGPGGALYEGVNYLPAGNGGQFGGGGGGATNQPRTGGQGDPGAVIVYY